MMGSRVGGGWEMGLGHLSVGLWLVKRFCEAGSMRVWLVALWPRTCNQRTCREVLAIGDCHVTRLDGNRTILFKLERYWGHSSFLL